MARVHPLSSGNSLGRRAFLVLLAALLVASTALASIPAADGEAYADDGTFVIAIDPGHGGGEGGASGNGVNEEQANWDIANACVNELNTYYGVKAILTTDFSRIYDREERVSVAVSAGARVLVSIHCNSVAGAPSAKGAEVWVQNASAYRNELHVEGKALGNKILGKLQALGLNNRGVKTRDATDGEHYPSPGGICDWYGINYHSRFAGIVGIIVEHAFVSNPDDAAKLASATWRTNMGKADAAAIAEYYGLTKDKPVEPAALDCTGEVVTTPIAPSSEEDPAIMGASRATAETLAAWYKGKNKTYPAAVYTPCGAATIDEFCAILVEEAAVEGVRAEVVMAQSMLETGWLQFGGDVLPGQCNFCGLGATGGGVTGEDFSGYGENAVRMGLRAQIQHLKGYASTEDLKQECVDNRFKYLSGKRGIAPTVLKLSGTWAGDTKYGSKIATFVNELLGVAGVPAAPTEVRISLADVPASLTGNPGATAFVDGVEKPLAVNGGYGTVEIAGEGTHSVVICDYENAGSANPHEVYPTHMYFWLAASDGANFSAKRCYGLDDMMQYAGSSIRVTGTKGIRMITGIPVALKDALSAKGVLGCTLVESGTLIAWSDRVGAGGLNFDTPGVSRGKAYVRADNKNPVFNKTADVEYYTNVLVGFSQAEQYKRDLTMRPYVILKDSSGKQFTVFGGEVQRSIGYIAQQNADAFSEGTAAYEFVHGIIDACKE